MEMVVALGIFSTVMLLSIGALVSVQNAQIRSGDVQAVHDNIRFAMEFMTKDIRQGSAYEGDQPDCSSGCGEMRFTKPNGTQFGYCVDAGKLVRFNITAGESCSAASAAILTANEVMVDGILFYILGQNPDPSDGQARVTIAVRVRSQSPSQEAPTIMDLQTTIIQRLREG